MDCINLDYLNHKHPSSTNQHPKILKQNFPNLLDSNSKYSHLPYLPHNLKNYPNQNPNNINDPNFIETIKTFNENQQLPNNNKPIQFQSQSQSQSSQSDSSENDASSVYEKYQISFEFKAPKTKEFIHIKDEIKRNNIITDTKLWANENENEIECDDTIEYLFNNTIHKLHKMKGNNYMESMTCPNIAKLGWRHGSYVPYIFGNHCEPWWARDAVYIMSKLLNKQMIGIEYGTGISSIWLSMLTKYVIAMEHDKIWQIGVNNITKKLNVNNLLVFQEHLGRRYCELDYSHSFDNNPGGYEWEKGKIDFFSMDGRLRYPATEWMLNWIKPHGGILLFDNSDRIEVGNKYGQHNATDLIPKHWLRYDSSYFKQHIDPIKDKRWLQNSMTSIWITRHEKCAKGTQNFGINDYNDDNDLNFKPF